MQHCQLTVSYNSFPNCLRSLLNKKECKMAILAVHKLNLNIQISNESTDTDNI